MIFSGSHNGIPHFDMVLDGTKTQTRRVADRYEVESERKHPHKVGYAIQRCRTCKATEHHRIVIDKKWKEHCLENMTYSERGTDVCISVQDALAEGGYTPAEYEKEFERLSPKWNGWDRWAYKYHVIEVPK